MSAFCNSTRAFKYGNSNKQSFIFSNTQVLTSFLFVVMVLLILTAWYYTNLPNVELHKVKEENKNNNNDNNINNNDNNDVDQEQQQQQQQEQQIIGFIYHCGEHENVLFYCVLTYIIFLSLASGFMAFKARRLPSNFKEAQYIWLAMFIACLAWITLFPLHITQSHANKPMVVMGVNGAVVACTLFVLYAYKVKVYLHCY